MSRRERSVTLIEVTADPGDSALLFKLLHHEPVRAGLYVMVPVDDGAQVVKIAEILAAGFNRAVGS